MQKMVKRVLVKISLVPQEMIFILRFLLVQLSTITPQVKSLLTVIRRTLSILLLKAVMGVWGMQNLNLVLTKHQENLLLDLRVKRDQLD